MRGSSRTIVAVLMLMVFMVSLAAYSFNANWLAHEIDHNRHSAGTLVDGIDVIQLGGQSDAGHEKLSDSEHQLLHAAGHVQPAMASSTFNGLVTLPTNIIISHLRSFDLPLVELEPPLRPPRSSVRS